MSDRYFWLKYVNTFSNLAADKINLDNYVYVDGIHIIRSNDECISYSLDGKNWVQSDMEEQRKIVKSILDATNK